MSSLYRVAYNEAGQYITVHEMPLVDDSPEIENEDYMSVVGTNLDLCIHHIRSRIKVARKILRPSPPPHDEVKVVYLEPKGLPSGR